jgi:thiamine pyrophosphate-dependent acetolactate synthase large subunit-like protein
VLGALAARRGAAIVTTVQGKDLVDPSHPNFAGCTMQSDLTKEAVAGATSCLALGSRVTELSSGSWSALPKHVVRVGFSNEDPLVAGATYAHLPISVDAAVAYLDAALPVLADAPDSTFGSESGARYRAARADKGRAGEEYGYLDAIAGALGSDDVLVCDMTKLAFWALLALDMPEGARWLWPGMLNMGFGLPAGIGAAVARPDAHVVVLCGDGGLLTIAPELDLLASTPGRISIVLIDDDGYGLLRPFASESVRARLCTFRGPDWEKLAEAFGVRYLPVDSGAHLAQALARGESGATLMHINGTELCGQNWRQA